MSMTLHREPPPGDGEGDKLLGDRAEQSGEDWLSTLIQWFEGSEEATSTNRTNCERDRDWYDGRQLTAEEISALEARGQPPLVFNLIRRKVEYLNGLEKQSRQDPRAYPRNPKHDQDAEAATDALRYVCDAEDFPGIASEVFDHVLIEGSAAVDVCVEERGDDKCVKLHVVPWDRLFVDQHSRKRDMTDAKFLGVVLWMDEADVLARWGEEARAVVESTYASTAPGDTYDDRPKHALWADAKRARVRVVQVYWQEDGDWFAATFTKGGFLEEPAPSAYVDEYGKGVCPLIGQSAYVDRDNNRYGAVRDLIDPQSEINKRRSKLLHRTSVRQVIAEQGAVADVDAARTELAKPDGYLEVAPGMRFDIQPNPDLAQGEIALLADAKAEFDRMGPNATMQGKQQGSASGRAIALSQQGGMIEAGPLLDGHRRWKKRVYEAIWQRIRQFWTEERWIRVTDDERNVRFVGLNRPVTLEDELRQMPPEQQGMAIQQMGLMPGDPRLSAVLRTENEVAKLCVDIVVDEMPDVVTLQSEQFETLAGLAKAGLPIPPTTLIRASSLRNKEELIEEMERMMAAQAQAQGAAAGPDPAPMAEVQRKAARDQADVALADRKMRQEGALAVAKMQQQGAIAQASAQARAQQPAPAPRG